MDLFVSSHSLGMGCLSLDFQDVIGRYIVSCVRPSIRCFALVRTDPAAWVTTGALVGEFMGEMDPFPVDGVRPFPLHRVID